MTLNSSSLPQFMYTSISSLTGPKYFDPLLNEFKEVGPVSEEIDVYMDWGKEELFKVIRGEGECAM